MKSAITLNFEDVGDTKDVEGKTDDSYTVEPVYSRQFFVAPAESRSNSHRKTPTLRTLL